MRSHPILAAACAAACAAIGAAPAVERAVPFWPDAVPEAIHAEVDGVAVLESVRELGRFHRVQGSPGFRVAAEHVRSRLVRAGLSDAGVLHYPADGATTYGHFRSYYGWTAESGVLEEISPRPRVIASFPELPVALADYSQDADVTAPLVDVGAGTAEGDYAGRSVRGKIVLADGPLPTVHRMAVEQRGAAGFLSAYPNQTTAWSGDDPDLVRWGHLSPYQTANTFAFMISKRQAAQLRERLASGESIVLKAHVKARMVPATYDIVTATIPGAETTEEEIVLTAHLCHQSAGANDNASGSAAILEVARSLSAAIRKGSLPPPRRTIRFLWLPEIAGAQAYLTSNPEIVSRMRAGIHMDMVGGLLATTRATFHLSRTAESLPHVANVVARVWLDHLQGAAAAYAEGGGDPWSGFAWPGGSKEPFLADMRPLEMGSDHQVFQDATYGVPMLYFHDWPDVTIHTNKDQPENMDATKLGRVAYLGAGIAWTLAALPDSEALRLADVARAVAVEEIGRAGTRAALLGPHPDAPLFEREAIVAAAGMLESFARMWPAAEREVERQIRTLRRGRRGPPGSASGDRRRPARSGGLRGPLDVYYYSHLAETMGPDVDTTSPLDRRDKGSTLAYEALNLADGQRSIGEIRDILVGRYGVVVPEEEISAWFDLLAKAGAVTISAR